MSKKTRNPKPEALLTTAAFACCCCLMASLSVAGDDKEDPAPDRDVARQRLEVMTSRIDSVVISSNDASVPNRMQPTPLFRYDDETRGYVDGTVWRLGEKGRPLAIITAELHPHYLNRDARVVYDLLSLTDRKFVARSADILNWKPSGSAVTMQALSDAPVPATAPAKRLVQMKEQARRFSGTQEVQELEKTLVHLRLMPRPIDRYSPSANEKSDGAVFLFANGRNPALLLLVETDGTDWRYGIGRLSMPSTLEMKLDDAVVWSQPRIPASPGWTEPYNASNSPADFP
jgi:hypothetical protein